MDNFTSTAATPQFESTIPRPFFSLEYTASWMILRMLGCALSAVTNALTIAVIIAFPSLRSTPTSYFLFSLSLSDFLNGISYGTHNTIRLLLLFGHGQPFFGPLSRAMAIISSCVNFNSLASMTWISVDRTIATSRPFDYKNIVTTSRRCALIIVTWVYVTTMGVTLGLLKYFSISDAERQAVVTSSVGIIPKVAYQYFIVPQIYLFLLTNLTLYLKIVVAVGVQKKKSGGGKKSEQMTKMIVVLLTVMLVCWLPGNILAAVKAPNPFTDPAGFKVFHVAYNLMMLNHSIPPVANAFIYTGQHKDFRRAYASVFACKARAQIGVSDTQ
jgi:hypothetical protein